MVLKTRPLSLFLALTALLLAAGCVKSHPVVKLPEKTPIAVAFVLDDDHQGLVGEVPDALKGEVKQILVERNLEPFEIPFSSYAQVFVPIRDSQRRLARLTNSEAPLTLLIETKALYFAQLSGRYRWTVSLKFTVARKDGTTAPLSTATDLSTFVDFEHQKESAVIATIASDLARRVGALLDEFLSANDLVEKKKHTALRSPADVGLVLAKSTSFDTQDDFGAIYFVMVDRFSNGDPTNDSEIDLEDPAAFHGGDLQGVIDHLDTLQEMGVGTIWLSPIFSMRTEKFFGHGAFHGYWIEDFERIEARFGDESLLIELSDELHRRGMKLVLDIVLNHVAMDSSRVAEKPDWFHGKGPLENWNDPVELIFHDVHGLPDLAQENPEVFDYLLSTSLKWIELVKPDGFRLDAVKHISNDFWARYNDAILEATSPHFMLLGELLDGDPRQLALTQRKGKFTAMFDFPLYFALIDVFCRGQSPTKLAAVFSSDRIYDRPETLVTLLDNHDLPRVLSDCGGDLEKVRQALTFQLTARGTPAINYGTESALTGHKEPENRGDMRFDTQPLRSHIQELLRLRATHPSLQSGAPILLQVEPDRLLYARVVDSEITLIAVNSSDEEQRFDLPAAFLEGELIDAMNGVHPSMPRSAVKVDAQGNHKLQMPARSTQLFFVRPHQINGFSSLATWAQEQWKRGTRKREVRFQARDVPLKPGEQIFLVGSGLEMGVWKPEDGLGPLDADGRLTAFLPVTSAYELKPVVRATDGSIHWAEGANKTIFINEGTGVMNVLVEW